MTPGARRSPTPAAVLTCVALAVLTSTFALLCWNDALDQAAAGDYAWPLDPATIARLSLDWVLTVTLMNAVVWVATLRQSRLGHTWRVPAAVAAGVAAWCGLAWRSSFESYGINGWFVPWPGPIPATAFVTDPTDPYATAALAVRPGALTPVLLVVGVAVVAWSARRHGRVPAARPEAPLRRARATALVVLGPPALAAITAATALQAEEYLTTTQGVVAVVVDPGFGLAVTVLAAIALAGTGRPGRVLLALVYLAVVGPFVARWWSGGSDDLVASATLGTLGVALAAAVHPVAMAISRLGDTGGGAPPTGSDLATSEQQEAISAHASAVAETTGSVGASPSAPPGWQVPSR